MAPTPLNTVVWRNAEALMRHLWKEVNQSRLAREAGIGKANTDRLKKAEGEFYSGTLTAIARALKVAPWQLLYPGLDPERPPQVLAYSEMAVEAARVLDSIPNATHRTRVYAMLIQLAELGTPQGAEAPEPTSPSPAPAERAKSRPPRFR